MSEWKTIQFGNAGKFQYGYTESSSEAEIGPKFLRITDIDLETGNIKWPTVPYCKIDESEFSKYELQKGDILFARIGATTGKSAIIKNHPKSVFASYLIRYKPDHSILNPEFVHFFTKSNFYWSQIQANSGGKLKKGVSSGLLKKFEIPMPPLPEQKKIATVLSIIQDAGETTEAVIDASLELKKSMMKHLFTYGPVPVSEAEKVPLKETEIGMVPEEWEEGRLSNYLKKTSQKDFRKTEDNINYIDVSSIDSESLSVSETKNYFGPDSPSRARKILVDGDTIFATIRPYLKRIAYIVENHSNCIASTAFCVLRPNTEILGSKFLFYYVQQERFVNRITELQRGASYPAVRDSDIKKQFVYLPSIEKQKRIVHYLEQVDEKIAAETTKKEALDTLFQSMLQQLMTGQLRVKDLDIPINEINHG